jgi:hypothetical protein
MVCDDDIRIHVNELEPKYIAGSNLLVIRLEFTGFKNLC